LFLHLFTLGKTTTLAAAVLSAVMNGEKVGFWIIITISLIFV
jgi:hypothetical protein